MADNQMQDLIQRLRRGEISSTEFQDVVRIRMGAGPKDMVVFRGVPSEGLNLGSWSEADQARFQELFDLPQTEQTLSEGNELWRRKRTAGGQFFSDRPEVALHYAKDTGSVHAMKLSPEEALKWSKGTQTTPGGISSNFQIPNEAIQAAQAEGRVTSGKTDKGAARADAPAEPGTPRSRRQAASRAIAQEQLSLGETRRGELEREIYEQERRLTDLNPSSNAAKGARKRVDTAKRALKGLGRLVGTASGVYEANRLAQDVGQKGLVGGTQQYTEDLTRETGDIGTGIEAMTELESPEERMGLETSGMTKAMRMGGNVAGAMGRGLKRGGRFISGKKEPFAAGEALAGGLGDSAIGQEIDREVEQGVADEKALQAGPQKGYNPQMVRESGWTPLRRERQGAAHKQFMSKKERGEGDI